mgnify:CR=1 FL=1
MNLEYFPQSSLFYIQNKEITMSRIQKLENHYHEKLTKHKIKDISEFIKSIIDADITKGKYARFLIESFLNNKFLEEDLNGGLKSTIGHAISLFDKHKGKLPIEQRSVYALDKETKLPLYQSPGDLWNGVKQFQGELSGKELKKEEQERIYRETEFIYKDEETGFQMVSPLTEESAKWWGKGTRWCTSADNDNMFDEYAKDAPLFILLMPNGDKLQVWKYENDIQFMDEADNEVTLDYIEQHWSILEPICMWLDDITFIVEDFRKQEHVLKYINDSNFYNFDYHYIPKSFLTHENIKLFLQKCPALINELDKEYLNNDILKSLIHSKETSLKYLPVDLIEKLTEEEIDIALKNNSYNLKYLNNPTYANCLSLVSGNNPIFECLPKKFINYQLIKQCLEKNPNIFTDIPDEYINEELCDIFMKSDTSSFHCFFKLIPEEFITEDFYLKALEIDSNRFTDLPGNYKTYDLCKKIVQKNPNMFFYIPFDKLFYEECYLIGNNLLNQQEEQKNIPLNNIKEKILEFKEYYSRYQETNSIPIVR